MRASVIASAEFPGPSLPLGASTDPDCVDTLTTPAPYTPPRWEVPDFPPIRAGGRGGRRLLRRALRRRRRPLAVALAVAAAGLLVSAANGAAPRPVSAVTERPKPSGPVRPHRDVLVRAPIRIADPAVAHLLHPGDRVDVMAGARVVAAAVRVVDVPADTDGNSGSAVGRDSSGNAMGGALVVLTVPRMTAAALSGAAAVSPLAVALC